MPAPSRFSAEQRARAVRFVIEGRDEYPSEWAVMKAGAANIGTMPETVRTGSGTVSCTVARVGR